MKILLFVRSLLAGGTERQIVLLARGLRNAGHDVRVAVFFARRTPLENELALSGIPLIDLRKSGRWDIAAFLVRLASTLHREQPDAIYSFLPVANALAIAARPFLRKPRVVVGVRASRLDLDRYDWMSRLSYWLEGRLARFADLAIANSAAGRENAIARGFPPARIAIVPNGIDGERFRPDDGLRQATRAAWKVPTDRRVIGVVARFDPMKGHAVFFDAARRMLAQRSDLRFVLVGSGPEEAALRARASSLGLTGALQFVAERADVEAALNAIDLLALPSLFGEGFSNVLGEAMACGVACVATDIGAARDILGGEGTVVPPGDAGALAAACLGALNSADDAAARMRRRQRVLALYGAQAMIEQTESLVARRP